jgi:hypothetical protein
VSSVTAARLAKLREKIDERDTSFRTASNVRTTLATFLTIYSKASRDCQLDYNEGTVALLNWLAPPELPLDLGEDKYPEAANPNFRVPPLLRGYASQELVSLLSTRETHHKVANLVYFTMSNEVIHELY